MREFDKLILENFAKYCDKKKIDVHDHSNFRLLASAYVSDISTIVIDFVEWSIEDDRNNNTHISAAVTAAEGSTHDRYQF